MSGSRTLGETLDDELKGPMPGCAPAPGLLLVFCERVPTLVPMEVGADGLTIGRDVLQRYGLRDDRMSRAHARVFLQHEQLVVDDLGSRNGTWVDGNKNLVGSPRVVRKALRCGRTVWIPTHDITPYLRSAVEERGGFVLGPKLRNVLSEVEALAERSQNLFVLGESGTGKELTARAFHEAGAGRTGPYVAVNCATVPPGLSERLFFGARRGVYSGAHEDAVGYFQAADGGTLFLDEVAELDLQTQAKLLRAIETREIIPLGQTKPRPVDVRIVTATLTPLDRAVSEGRFREDLYHRLARPIVRLPPLRERMEELPFLVRRVLCTEQAEAALEADLIEQCLLRDWPGNVRQLLSEVGQHASRWLRDPTHVLDFASTGSVPNASEDGMMRSGVRRRSIDVETAKEAVEKCGGNVSAAARLLGLHRTQLRRILARTGD